MSLSRDDKLKMKILAKRILIEKSRKALTSRQIADTINKHNYGFRDGVTPTEVGKILSAAISQDGFLKNISCERTHTTKKYYIKQSDIYD